MPADLVDEIDTIALGNQVNFLLNSRPGLLDCLMLRSPVKKVEKSNSMPILFFFLNVVVFATLILFLFPLWPDPAHADWLIFFELLAMVLWVRGMMSDAGKIHPTKDMNPLDIM